MRKKGENLEKKEGGREDDTSVKKEEKY